MADNGSKFVQDLAQIGKATAQGGPAQDMLNEAINRGNKLATDNQIIMDRQNLTPFQFGQKYPQAVQGQLDQLDQGNAELQNYMKGATRDGLQAVGDTTVDVATGLVSTLGGIAALGAGGVHPALGVATNKLVNDAVTYGRSAMSQDVKRNEYIGGIQGALDNQDTAAQYEQDQKTDGSLVAGLKKIGRDTLNAGSRTVQNPTILKSTVAQGVGSLLAGGPIGKGLGLLGVAEKFAMPAAIGLMEGGGAYGQTVSDIMGRSHEDLMKTSPDYRAAIQAGTDPETAKAKIANNAGLTAAAVQGVAGAAIGKVAEVGPFEAAPLKLRPIADVASNLVKEPLEEAAQSLTGQVTQNAAIKMQADPNQSLTEGVGDQVALGAIGGLGSAGVVQAPSVAAGALYHTAKATGAAIMYPINKLMAAGEQQIAENKAASPVSSQTLAPAVQEAATTAPQVAQGLQTLLTEGGAKKEDADAYINRVSQASQLTETDMQGVPPALAADLKGYLDENKLPQNKFTALHFMAEVAANKDNSDEERVAAGTFVTKNIENNKKLFTEDFPEALKNIPHDRPEFQQFNGYASILNAIQDNPEIQSVIKYASEDMKMPEQDLSGIDFGSEKGQQLVDHATEVASVAPHAVDLNTANMILSQADSGKVKLLPAARRMLSSAVALQNVAALRANLMKLIGTPDVNAAPQAQTPVEDPREMLKFVTQQIKETGGRKADHLSLSQHLAGINQAVTQNDLKGAQAKAQRLANFAQSRINKLVAVNESIANGDGKDVQYKNWSGTDFYTDKKGVGAKLGSAGGRAFARTVYADARAVAELSNEISKIYPAFQLKQLTVPDLGTNNQVNINKGNEGSSTTAASQPSQATTSKTVDVVQKELPSPPTQSARETTQPTPAVEEVKAASTGTTENTSSERVVEPVQSAAKPNAEPVASASADQAQTKESTKAEITPKFEITGNGKIEFSEPVPTQEEPQTETPGLAGRFPNLVQPASGNMFHKAFTLPKTVKSRLLGMAEPMRAIWKALDNKADVLALRDGKDIDGYDLTGADAKNLRRLIQKGADALNLMTASLEDKLADGKVLAKIKSGELSTRTRDLRILNLLEVDDTGKYQYNQDLIQSAMLAGLDWVLNIAERSSPMKADEVAGILGIDEGEAAQYLKEFNRGMSLTIAKRSLAERIQKFWGVNANRDGRKAFTVGIPEAVAAEMLQAFHQLGLIDLRIQESKDVDNRLRFPNVGPDKNFNWVWMDNRSQDNQAFINNFDKVSKFFTDMALTDREGEGASIGSPIQEVAQTQHRNPMVQLTKQNKQALANAQQTPYRPNTIVHDFFQALTEERYVSMLVDHPYKKSDLNKTHKEMGLNKGHWKSLQGQMRSYVSSYRNVAKQMEQVKEYAKKQGIPLEEAAVYYGHDINKLGRPQMRGLSNPQTDKGAREVFMSTGSELDLSGNTPDMAFFLQTIAQGIGLKTEQETRAAVGQKVTDKVFTEGGEFYPLVQQLKSWVANHAENGDLTIPDSVDVMMKGLSQHGIHSLISAARYLHAKETGQDLSKFKTSNYLEADGKTNGPINALMLFASGAFSPGWLKAIGKGGAFVGRLGQTLNSWGDKVDLYKDGANVTQVKMEELGKNIAANGSPEAHEHFQTFLRLMKGLNANIKVTESGEITIERNLTKNPLTITIYGSGPRGIAGKVAGELVTAIYEKMSDGISSETPFADSIYGEGQTGAFLQDLSALTSQSIRQNRESKKFFIAGNVQQVGGSLDTFEFSKEQFNTLRDNVHTMLVTPMVAAINAQVTQHIAPVKDALLKATQLQSIVLKNMFVTEVAKRIAVMKADPEKYNYRDTEFLSQKELDEIMDNLERFSPIINTGTQAYMLSGGETSDLGGATNPEDYSRTLKSKLSTPAFVTGPTTVGVGGVPTLTIGSGDAQMMMNFLAENPEAAKRVLHVFDGLNVPADQIENYSNLINQSVFKTWTSNTNPVRAIHDSFKAFMDAAPIEALFTGEETAQQLAALNEMTRIELGRSKFKDDERITPADAKLLMDRTLNNLSNLADDTDIRRQILAEMPFSVDQMAGGEKPHVNQGKIQLPENPTNEQILDAMNKRRAELSTKQPAVIEPVAEQPKAPVKTVGEFVNQRGFYDDESGAMVLNVRQLDGLSGMSDMTGTQKEMLDASIEALRKDNYTLVFGNEDQLDAWEREYNADVFVPGSNSVDFGRTYVGKKLIVIKNMTAETLVHELVHASTIQKTANPVSKEEREAVARLGNLMEQWLDETYPDITDQATDDAFEGAYSVVDGLLAKGDQVGALNEFMAYVLSNQDLSRQAAKTKVTNPLVRIIGDALNALKALIFGKTKVTDPGEDLLSNLRFNTRILMGPQTQVEGLKQDFSDTVLHQSASFGSSDRLTALREAFNQKIISWINDAETGKSNAATKKAARDLRQIDADNARQSAQDLANTFAYHFQDLGSMQAFSTFSMIQQALMTEARLNTNSLARVGELHRHVMDKLKVEDFMQDPDLNDPNDRHQAQDKLNALSGVFQTKTDKYGRTSLMSSFLALAMTSDGFRKILSEMEVPKSEKSDERTMDAHLENAATAGMDRLSLWLAGEKGADVQAALDSLTSSMLENVGDQRSHIAQNVENRFDQIERVVADKIQETSSKINQKAQDIKKNTKSRAVKAAASVAIVAGTIVNETDAELAALGLTAALNKHGGFDEIRSLVNEVQGRTRENAPIYDMISKVRAWVQQTRQQYRDELPIKLAKAFTKPVSQVQWTAMFKALGKTDLAVLTNNFGVAGALDLVARPQRVSFEIKSLERALKGLDANRFDRLKAKSVQLADFMMTGNHGSKLLRNAEAIARLLGERGMKQSAVSPQLVDTIDRLVSLYALQKLDADTIETVSNLVKDEMKGLDFVTNYLVGQRVEEMGKAKATTEALYNHYKGHIPSEAKQGGSLIIASDSEHAHLVSRGYKHIADYTGSSADRSLGKRSYYFAPVSGTAIFNQGVLQTVHQTASGVDPETGYTTGEIMAGRIDDAQTVKLIDRHLGNAAGTNENLLPVYDDAGNVVAFERAADPEKLGQLNRSTDLAKMIGVWRGRQVEELAAQESNKELVDNLFAKWEEDRKAGRAGEYVNIAKLGGKDDRILIEATKLIPNQARDYIKSVFGPDTFMVRRDMLLDTFGGRQASIGDLFTGKTRWNPTVTSTFEKLAMGAFGNKAYPSFVSIEKNIQEFVSTAKTRIVVKSVIVPAANAVSNMFQLLNRGVPFHQVVRGFGAKTSEINAYIKGRRREVDLEADLRAAQGKNDLVEIRKIENKIQSLKDSYKRMSIWPLVEAGEFSAISNGNVTTEDLALADGKWSDWVEQKARELPAGFNTAARYALVTKDTALFQGLARSVQYGDFVAKAVLYDDMIGRQKMTKEEALGQVGEPFVNYDRLSGRSMQYLDSIGLMWFYKYKIRIMKEAAHMLRHNPLRSLLMTAVPNLPLIGDIGSPTADNVLAIASDGKLNWSLGPSMGLHSFGLNPWLNLAR